MGIKIINSCSISIQIVNIFSVLLSNELKATHPTDIRFSGQCNADMMHQMNGTFATNDWDSDVEDSNSSEEFLYAKEASQIDEHFKSTQNTAYLLDTSRNQIDMILDESIRDLKPVDEQLNTQDIWNSHEDLIGVSTKGKQNCAYILMILTKFFQIFDSVLTLILILNFYLFRFLLTS